MRVFHPRGSSVLRRSSFFRFCKKNVSTSSYWLRVNRFFCCGPAALWLLWGHPLTVKGRSEMENRTIADIFTEIADILDIQGENPFRVRSYRNAARTIGDMSQSLESMVKAGKNLGEIPGIGKSISDKIHEILS